METGQKSEKKKRSSVQMVLQILVLALIGAGIGLYITSLGRSPEYLMIEQEMVGFLVLLLGRYWVP